MKSGHRPVNENRIIHGAFLLSLVLHLVLAAVIWKIPFDMTPTKPVPKVPTSEEIEILLENFDDTNVPKYVNMPARLAQDEPVAREEEQPDYVSMFNTRAADLVQDGVEDLPTARIESESPQVSIQAENLRGAPGMPQNNSMLFRESQPPVPSEQRADATAGQTDPGEQASIGGEMPLPSRKTDPAPLADVQDEQSEDKSEEQRDEVAEEVFEEWWQSQDPSVYKEGDELEISGDLGFDFDQMEMGSVGSGVAAVDEFSLNTWDWNYGPWLQHFSNDYSRALQPPYAFTRLGIIGGTTRVRLVISKDGRLLALDRGECDGHDSLHQATENAINAIKPFRKLPAHFPEEVLILSFTMRYINGR